MPLGRALPLAGLVAALASVIYPSPSPAQAPLQDENLLFPMPEGFVLGHDASQGRTTYLEFIHESDALPDWDQLVTMQIFREAVGLAPSTFAGRIGASLTQHCAGAAFEMVHEGLEAGLPVAVFLSHCPQSPVTGGPEFTVYKAIGGVDALYVLQRAWRDEPTNARVTTGMQMLQQAAICDTRRAERPCPDQ